MRTSFFIFNWVVIVSLAQHAATSAQQPGDGTKPPDDRPYVFFSASPDESPDAKPANPIRQINLRPNQEQPFFVYVHNPTDKKKAVKVQLVSTRKTGAGVQTSIAAEASVDVEANKTARVALTANKAQLPAAPVAAPAGDKAAPPPPPSIPLYGNPFVRAVSADGSDNDAPVSLRDVSTYAEAKKDDKSTAGFLRLKVNRKADLNYTLVGRSIPVRLEVRDKNGEPVPAKTLAVQGNSLEGYLATGKEGDGAQTVELALNTAGLADATAEVTVDGVPRAFAFKLEGTTSPAKLGVLAPRYLGEGKPLPVRLLADTVPTGGTVEVIFDRTGTGTGAEVRRFNSARDEGIGVRVGASGEAIFHTRSVDWVAEFPTQGVFGTRQVYAKSAAGDSAKKDVTFDGSAPVVAPPVAVPANARQNMYRPGQRIRVTASADDPESGIDDSKAAIFYLGERPGPDGKPAPGSVVKVGTKRLATVDEKPLPNAYEAEFVLPVSPDGTQAVVGVIYVNRLGMPGENTTKIVIDPTPPDISVIAITPPKGIGSGYQPGDTIRLSASAYDDESGIDLDRPPLFFLGDPPGPDGKPTQGTLELKPATGVIPGQKGPRSQPFWAADFTLPADIKKETDIKFGVWFVNGVGLPGVRVGTLKIAIDGSVGTIKAKVVKGGNEVRQSEVTVYLLDANNKVAAQAVTDDCGLAEFPKLIPGRYTVWAVKPSDGNSQAFKVVEVRGGEIVDVALAIKRSP